MLSEFTIDGIFRKWYHYFNNSVQTLTERIFSYEQTSCTYTPYGLEFMEYIRLEYK